MPVQNRYYSSAYLATLLPGGAAASGSVVVSSVTGSPSPNFPFTMLLDWGLTTQEAISVTAITGTGPYTLTCTRGIDGTTAQSHSSNAIAVHGLTEQDYSEPQIHINATGPYTDPESGNTVAVHGIAASSAVVGTIDTQTLTNKTLTSPTITGATFSGTTTITGAISGTTEALVFGSATGAVLTVTNTTATPSAATFQLTAAAAADRVTSIQITSDTVPRLAIDSNGKHLWGSGSGAGDTDLYRSAANTLTTDTGFTAGTTITAGTGITATTGNIVASAGSVSAGTSVSATTTVTAGTGLIATTGGITVSAGPSTIAGNIQLASATGAYAGGTGVVGLANASVNPSGTVSGGGVLYSKSGLLTYLNSAGLNSIIVGSQAAAISPVTTSVGTITSLASMSVPANDPVAGAQYVITGYGTITSSVANACVWDLRWGGTAGTLLTSITNATNAPAMSASITNQPFFISGTVTFRSTTTAVAELTITWQNSTATTGLVTATSVQSTAQTVTVSSAELFTLDVTTVNTTTAVTMVASSCERIS